MSVPKAVIHTDLFIDHLWGKRTPSLLRVALQKFFCYTTVFQAIELFSLSRNEQDTQAINDSMAALKVLGLNAKGARRYGELLRTAHTRNRWNLVIAGLCLESRLPIITGKRRDFVDVAGLVVIPARLVLQCETGADVLDTVNQE